MACSSAPGPADIDYHTCLTDVSERSLEVMTWNLEKFPLTERTIPAVTRIIGMADADVVALQEITSELEFDTLVSQINGWEGQMIKRGPLSLGFIYKSEEINFMEVFDIYTDKSYVFPRAPLVCRIQSKNGLQTYIIDIHLKCCDGTENEERRRMASGLLKEYIDQHWPDDPVMVIGDFNDEIGRDVSNSVFKEFLIDSLNYSFADKSIAIGSEDQWSYPSWPSHIDHMLITNELFDHVNFILTLRLDQCNHNYFMDISDHRPLLISLD